MLSTLAYNHLWVFVFQFDRSLCWTRLCINRAELLIRWRPGCLHTELVWRVATQCHFAIHSTRTCQCDSWPIEPCIFATSMLEYIPAIPCPRDDVAMFEMLFGASKRNWGKPSSASPLLQDMQLPTFFWDYQPAAKNVLIRPYSLAASVLWFIPAFCPRRQRS